MSDYKPKVGHRVHVEFDGEVTDEQPGGAGWTCVTYYRRSGDTYFAHLHPGTPGLTIERLPDPEPKWQPGDVVRDALGCLWVKSPRNHGRGWDQVSLLGGATSHWRADDAEPIARPLTPLVRDGKPWAEATA